jgi:hypothetical protein
MLQKVKLLKSLRHITVLHLNELCESSLFLMYGKVSYLLLLRALTQVLYIKTNVSALKHIEYVTASFPARQSKLN